MIPMTFDELLGPNGTADERRALAWQLGMIRLRKTVEALADAKRCFTYCGDDKCDCGAGPNDSTPTTRGDHER